MIKIIVATHHIENDLMFGEMFGVNFNKVLLLPG